MVCHQPFWRQTVDDRDAFQGVQTYFVRKRNQAATAIRIGQPDLP